MYYHVWFATKRRKWLLQGDIEDHVKQEIEKTAQDRGVRLLQYETVVNHVHLLLELQPGDSLSRTMQLLKGVSSRSVLRKFPEIRLDAGINHFWQKRYGSKSVERSALPKVSDYIRTQKDRLEKFER